MRIVFILLCLVLATTSSQAENQHLGPTETIGNFNFTITIDGVTATDVKVLVGSEQTGAQAPATEASASKQKAKPIQFKLTGALSTSVKEGHYKRVVITAQSKTSTKVCTIRLETVTLSKAKNSRIVLDASKVTNSCPFAL